MKISTREKILIILLVFSVVIGISGCILLDGRGREQSDEYLEMLCKENGASINDALLGFSARLDVVTSNIESELDRAMVNPTYEVFARRLAGSSYHLLKQILDEYKGHSFAYIRFNEDFGFSDIGYFLERTENSVETLPLTDISAYDPGDMEHVGWYYVPKEYGAAIWMEPYMNKNVDTYMISYVVPVYYEDEFYCLVGLDIDLAEILNKVRGLSIYESGFGLLYDKTGSALNEPPVDDITDYAQALCKLDNGMTLKICAPNNEVYPMHYSSEYSFLILFYIVMLIIILIVILVSLRLSREGDQSQGKGRSHVIVILRGFVVLLFIAQIMVLVQTKERYIEETFYVIQEQGHEKTLRAVAEKDFAPFSYVGDNGLPAGYDIELVNALANKMGVNISVELKDSFDEARRAVERGDADILLGVEEISARGKQVLAHTAIVATDNVGVYGKKKISGIGDLQNSKIAAVEGDEFPDLYNIFTDASRYQDIAGAMASVVDGTNDYAVVRGSSGDMVLGREGFKNLIRVYDLMESQMSIGVSKEDAALLRQLNSAISELRSNGTMDKLNDKWLQVYSGDTGIYALLKENETFYLISGMVILLAIVILLIMTAGEKKRAIAIQTDMDALTGINNRGAGERKIRELIHEGAQGMFLLFDVDKFKTVNDNYGHAVGDKVLAAIASCLKRTSRQGDVVMRFGGDEYMAYVVGINNEKSATAWFERLFNAIDNISIPELADRKVTVSAGVVLSHEKPESFEVLYNAADSGAYQSKKQQGNAYTFCDTVPAKKDEGS